MEFWIEGNVLMAWTDSRRIQSRVIARGVVDGDLNRETGEWLIVRENGQVEKLDARLFTGTRFSDRGVRARWSGDQVMVQESDGRNRLYNSRGFWQRDL